MTIQKAEKFKSKALDLGWATEIIESEVPGLNEVVVEASRGAERVRMGWRDGKLLTLFDGQRESCHYELPGVRKHQLNNISAALKIMAESPNYIKHKQKRMSAKPVELSDEEIRSSLPYDDETPDKEVLRVLYGRTLVWRNSITGEFQEENVKPMIRGIPTSANPKGEIISQGNYNKHNYYIKHVGEENKRVLHFVGTSGFRAVDLAKIMSVR